MNLNRPNPKTCLFFAALWLNFFVFLQTGGAYSIGATPTPSLNSTAGFMPSSFGPTPTPSLRALIATGHNPTPTPTPIGMWCQESTLNAFAACLGIGLGVSAASMLVVLGSCGVVAGVVWWTGPGAKAAFVACVSAQVGKSIFTTLSVLGTCIVLCALPSGGSGGIPWSND